MVSGTRVAASHIGGFQVKGTESGQAADSNSPLCANTQSDMGPLSRAVN